MRSGFSLFEIAIGLSVLSVVLSGVLPFVQSSMKSTDTEMTLKRMDDIEAAMVAFRLANKRIPCPASLAAALTSSAYGTEAATPGTCTGVTTTDTNAVSGGVPVKALGLPDEWGFDAWGRRFAYHADKRMTGANATDTYGAADTTTGIFTVYDGAGTPAARTTKAEYVIVSHGMNGHGGIMLNGTARKNASSANTHEQANCKCDNAGAATAYNLNFYQHMSTTNPSNILDNFDDLVRYRLRAGLDTLVVGGGGGGAAAAGNTGEIQFNGGGNVFDADSNLFWDDTTKRLGIGTASPAQRLDVAGNVKIAAANPTGTSQPSYEIGFYGTNSAATGINQALIKSSTNGGNSNYGNLNFYTMGSSGMAQRMTIDPSGNVVIGATWGANKLGVLGSASIGSGYYGTAAPTNGAIIEGNVGIGTTAPGEALHVVGRQRVVTSDSYALNFWKDGTPSYAGAIGIGNNRLGFSVYNGSSWLSDAMVIMPTTGNVGIGTTSPATKLDVAGTVKIANGGETCDATKAGAIRYNSGTFEGCNGTAWSALGGGLASCKVCVIPSSVMFDSCCRPAIPAGLKA